MPDTIPNPESDEGHTNQEYNPTPDPEWRGYYGVAGFWIFGELLIWLLCFKITDDSTYWLVLITASVSFIIFIAMLVQIEVTKLQWRAMREGLVHSEKSLYFRQRAYLTVADDPIVNDGDFSKGSKSISLDVLIKNVGFTPARNTSVTFGIGYILFPLTEDRNRPEFGEREIIPLPIFRDTPPHHVLATIPIPDNFWDDDDGRERRWVVYIRMQYDSFPDKTEIETIGYMYSPPPSKYRFMIIS